MLDYRWKRLCSGLLALALVAGMLPPVAVAAEETEATEVVEVLETEPVTTEPVETTVATEVVTEPVEETVAETTETTEFVLPENVVAVQVLIDALPTVDTVTAEDYDAVQDAYDAYDALTDEEKALIQGAEVFEALFAWFNAQTATLEAVANGTCGESLTWTLDDTGTLTISGTGEMTDYYWDGTVRAPWYPERSNITTVIIGEGVTSIGSYAFDDCYYLASITIPGSVTRIGESALSGCSKLTTAGPIGGEYSIAFGWTTSIPDGAFSHCYYLTNVTIPEGITSIGNETFFCCSSLTSITIPKGVTSIGDRVFYECNDLTSVTIPDTVTSIGETVFYGCESLTGITIPESVTSIGDSAFYGCSSLTSITIPEGVTSIGESAFCECDNLTSVTIPWSVTYIGGYAFWCKALAEIHFTHRSWDTLEIEDGAFYTNETYRKLTLFVPNLNDIPEAVSGYDWSANRQQIIYRAEGSRPVTGIALTQAEETVKAEVGVPVACKIQTTPTGTTSDILWSVIPGTGTASVTQSGVVTGITPGTVTVRVASAENDSVFAELPLTILFPTGGEPTAITVTTGGLYENEVAVGQTIPMIVSFTPANASSRNVTWEVQNGTGTARIDQQGNLTGLTPGSVTVWVEGPNGCIGSYKVDVVRYAEGLEIFLDGEANARGLGIGEKRYLSAVLSPEDTTTENVEWAVFNGTGAAELEKAQWEELYWITGTRAGTVTLVAVAKDSHAVQASIELEVTDTIQPYAVTGGNIYYNTETGYITGCDASVTAVNIPAQIGDTTIVGIRPEVFVNVDAWHNYYDNTTLTTVYIPATVREIGDRAFYQCTALTSLRFAGNSQLTTVGERAFCDCSGLTSLSVPTGITSVGKYAFSGMSGLKHLTISGEVDSRSWGFGYYYDGNGLQTITYTGGFIRGGTRTTYAEGYTRVEPGVFCYAQKLILSDSVTTIGDYAFAGSDVTEVVLGEHVATIGQYAFSNCQQMTTVDLPDNLTTIGQYAFQSCYQLAVITLPESLTELGKGCFEGCGKLNMVDLSQIPDTISEAQYLLNGKATLPDHIIKATDGKVSFEWEAWHARDDHSYDDSVAYVIHYANGKVYLECRSSGQIELTCKDEYTGLRASKIIDIKAGIQIRPTDLGYLTSGQNVQLSAWMMPSGTKASVEWFLSEGDEDYATLTSAGKLTAKTVTSARQITVNAAPYSGGETVAKSIWILPKATDVTIDQGSAMTVDMHESSTWNLSVTTAPADALDEVKWTTSDKKIATVDEAGMVTFLKPGTVTITATANDGSKKSDKVTLTVYYLDTASKLTATADIPTIGLQPGQTGTITVKGTEVLDATLLDVVSSAPNVASVAKDESGNWIVVGGEKAGTATITASIAGDPLKRKTTCKVKVIAMQAQDLVLSTDIPEEIHDDQPMVVLNAADTKAGAYTFTVSSQALGYDGCFFDADVTWASGNTAIATVKDNKDGTATVTVKKGASGECAITATTKDLNKVTTTLWLSVRDYAPRLANASPAMNLYQSSSVDVDLLTSYENGIESVNLYEKEEISRHFTAAWMDGTMSITALEGTGKGTYTQTLKVTCANGEIYDYILKIKVTETAPSVTVKQTVKPNLFYTDTTAALTLTAKNAQVTDVAVISGDFTGEFENGVLTLTSDVPNPGKKVTLEISVAGYEKPVEKTVSLSTVTTAPKLKLSTTSSTINTALSEDRSTSFQVLSGTEVLTLEEGDITYSGSFADWILSGDDTITLTLNGAKGGTATLNIQKSNWTKPVKLTHKITVQTALPTLKLGATTLKLNSVFPEQGVATTISLSQGNLTLSNLEITSTAKAGTALADEAEKLRIDWDGENDITATIEDETIKTGTYAFSCVGTMENGETLKAVTLKVTVSATNPKVKLASTTLKLNRYLAGVECVSTAVTAPAGYTLEGFAGMEDAPLSYANGLLTACLSDATNLGGTYTIYPVLIPEGGSEPITLDTGLKVKVTTYNSSALSATVSTKGKLDTLNPESVLICTINLKNCTGPIDGVSLSGENADLFCAEVDEDGKVIVRLVEGLEYATNKTYKVTLDMTVCGQTVSKAISFKVTQSTLKVTATPSTLTCYQAIGYGATTLKLTSSATVEFADVAVSSKTTAALLNALGDNGMRFDLATGRLTLKLAHPGLLAPGKSYTLYLDVTPEHNATNVKPTQVKLTIKVQK